MEGSQEGADYVEIFSQRLSPFPRVRWEPQETFEHTRDLI